ncbi:MAG: hypothetical protein FWE45_03120 [Firmicutes bacterium]|nr:hypothetical protein [Bacillota bacterium]
MNQKLSTESTPNFETKGDTEIVLISEDGRPLRAKLCTMSWGNVISVKDNGRPLNMTTCGRGQSFIIDEDNSLIPVRFESSQSIH